jgi:hypothetical protein
LWTNSEYDLHISKKEEMSVTTNVWKHLFVNIAARFPITVVALSRT